jgi:hypothetical protein
MAVDGLEKWPRENGSENKSTEIRQFPLTSARLNSAFLKLRRPTATGPMTSSQHVYEFRPRKDKRCVDLISDALPFGRLWYGEPNAVANAIGYAGHFSRSHHAVIRVCDAAGNVIETHEHKGKFREP